MSSRQYWMGLAQLVRPLGVLGIGIYAAASVFWTGFARWGVGGLLGFSLGAALIAAGGYAYNDVRDVRIDRVSHPNRPLVRNVIRRKDALACAWITSLFGLGSFALIGRSLLAIGMLTVTFLFVYSRWLKDRLGFLGNILLSFSLGLMPVYAGFHAGHVGEAIWLTGVVVGLMLSREVVKDIEDRIGDSAHGRRTLATTSCQGSSVVVVAGAVITVGASLLLISRGTATGFIILGLDVILGLTILRWLRDRDALVTLKRVLKAVMFGFAVLFLIMGILQ